MLLLTHRTGNTAAAVATVLSDIYRHRCWWYSWHRRRCAPIATVALPTAGIWKHRRARLHRHKTGLRIGTGKSWKSADRARGTSQTSITGASTHIVSVCGLHAGGCVRCRWRLMRRRCTTSAAINYARTYRTWRACARCARGETRSGVRWGACTMCSHTASVERASITITTHTQWSVRHGQAGWRWRWCLCNACIMCWRRY